MSAPTFRGFEFDPGDPSVGIFGDDWIHADCHYDPPFDEAPEGVSEHCLATTRVNDYTVRDWYLLTCTDCGTQTIVTRDDYCPSPEADAAERAARERWEAEERFGADPLYF